MVQELKDKSAQVQVIQQIGNINGMKVTMESSSSLQNEWKKLKEEPEDYYEMLKEEPELNIERTKSCINVKIEKIVKKR